MEELALIYNLASVMRSAPTVHVLQQPFSAIDSHWTKTKSLVPCIMRIIDQFPISFNETHIEVVLLNRPCRTKDSIKKSQLREIAHIIMNIEPYYTVYSFFLPAKASSQKQNAHVLVALRVILRAGNGVKCPTHHNIRSNSSATCVVCLSFCFVC